jgi:site-specific DNA recombinase
MGKHCTYNSRLDWRLGYCFGLYTKEALTMSKRAIIYGRVSTDLQRENYSISNQARDCIRYANSKGYNVIGNQFINPETGEDATIGLPMFVDDFTSRELNRPALDAAMQFLEDVGFDVLIVANMDRWARDPYFARALINQVKRRGAVVEFVDGGYTDDLQGEVDQDEDALDAKKEIVKFVKRSKKGKLAKARDGLYVCGAAPYGYRIDAQSKGGLAVVDEQAKIVQLIFTLYVNHYTLSQLVGEVNKTGITPAKGGTQ